MVEHIHDALKGNGFKISVALEITEGEFESNFTIYDKIRFIEKVCPLAHTFEKREIWEALMLKYRPHSLKIQNPTQP